MTEWFSIKDRLPENGSVVLCSDTEEIWVGIYNKPKSRNYHTWITYPMHFSSDVMELNFSPTHWAELPEPPND